MEKTTTIELEFESLNNFEGTVTLTRKGRVENVVFELAKKNARDENTVRFHFKGERSHLDELHKFIGRVLQDSFDELHPEDAKRAKALQEKEAADATRESWEKKP